jgi:protease-4
MTLDADAVVDRRRLKRRLVIWRLATVAALLLLALVVAYQAGALIPRAYVATIDISGVIYDRQSRLAALSDAATDTNVRALIVQINSPGGTVVAGEALYLAIREVAEAKPVIAVIGSVGASAGYLVAIAADHILARESSITGSIGVLVQTTDITEFLQNLGISAEAIKSTPLKATPSPLEPLTPAARAATQAVVDDIYRWFVDLVAERRNLSTTDALQLADGRIFTGRQAVTNTLIDGIGSIDEAWNWLHDTYGIALDLPTVAIDPNEGKISSLDLLGLARKTLFSETLKLDGLVSVWQPGITK